MIIPTSHVFLFTVKKTENEAMRQVVLTLQRLNEGIIMKENIFDNG